MVTAAGVVKAGPTVTVAGVSAQPVVSAALQVTPSMTETVAFFVVA